MKRSRERTRDVQTFMSNNSDNFDTKRLEKQNDVGMFNNESSIGSNEYAQRAHEYAIEKMTDLYSESLVATW